MVEKQKNWRRFTIRFDISDEDLQIILRSADFDIRSAESKMRAILKQWARRYKNE